MKTNCVFKQRRKKKIFSSAFIFSLLFFVFNVCVFAAGEDSGGESTGEGGGSFSGSLSWENSGLSSITNILIKIIEYVGWTIVLLGAAQVILAFKDEQTEGKVRGMTMVGIGAGLTTISTFIDGVI